MTNEVILAGDIGGTKTNLAFFEPRRRGARRAPGHPRSGRAPFRAEAAVARPVAARRFANEAHGGLVEIVRIFVAEEGHSVEEACFGVAGPVRENRCAATNLPWVVDGDEIGAALGLPAAWVINDLEANAYGIAELGPADFLTLQEGDRDARGNAAILAAGTGLGEAGLYWDGNEHRPFACEGGHTDFAPADELEAELLSWCRGRWEHVSWERLVSGPGLYTLYQFLRDTERAEEPAGLSERLAVADPAPVISRAALEEGIPICVQALDLFVALYGAEAGNLALKVMARRGLYVGGGIAPRIQEKMREGRFLERFLAKGRMRPLLETMPVRVILNDRTALLGAARYAMLKPTGTTDKRR